MMPKKPDAQKRKPTGVSIEASLLERVKAHARKKGYPSLSSLIVKLLVEELDAAADGAEKKGKAQIKKAKGKVRRGGK